MGQGAFLMKGLENVRAELSLTALAYNMRRVINILGKRCDRSRPNAKAGAFPARNSTGMTLSATADRSRFNP